MKLFKSKLSRRLFAIFAAVAIIFGACALYVSNYYKADSESIAAFSAVSNAERRELEGGALAFIPKDAKAGFVFYPGGKVEHAAYEPLMRECAERGILCVLVKMPFNLAVFDINAADGIKEKFPEVSSWGIGGHSLGGSMAGSYIAGREGEFNSLILLASYCTADLSQSSLKVLSLYGNEDKVLNLEKYQKYKPNLPKDTAEFIIEGGNHAYFGVYGEQKGDGKAQITRAEQIEIAADKIAQTLLG